MPALFQLKHDLGDHRDVETCRNNLVSVRENLARRVAEQHLGVVHDKQAVGDLAISSIECETMRMVAPDCAW